MRRNIFVVLILLVVLALGLLSQCSFIFPLNYEKAEKIFQKNKAELIEVSDYLAHSQYSDIYITSSMSDNIMSNAGEHVEIEQSEIVVAITFLKKQGYSVIGKDRNTVYFQKWSGFDESRGIAYSMDGSMPSLQFITKAVRLSEDNWYYYEEDFSEWEAITNGKPREILGTWSIGYAINRNNGEIYPLEDLYGSNVNSESYLQINSDDTFIRNIGVSANEGVYMLRYENKLLLEYEDGTRHTVEYLPETQELIYYDSDENKIPVAVYYRK